MTNTDLPQPQIPKELIENLKAQFVERGFSEKNFQLQLQELGKLIIMSSLSRLIQQKPPSGQLTLEEANAHIANNFSQEEIQAIFADEARRLAEEYLRSIK